VQDIVVPPVPPAVQETAEAAVASEGRELDNEERIELARKRQALQHEIEDQEQRRSYARKLFQLTVGWFAGIAVLLLLQGFNGIPLTPITFKLADSILLALISSTTVNVIAVFVIVVNYLFPKRG
jgi:hypothetical protein